MATFKILKIDNSKKAAIRTGKWKNPGAKLYDQLLNAASGKVPNGPDELEKAMKTGEYKQWPELLKEAYLVAPVENIKNSPYGVTPFSRSGCKYPHHVIRGDKLLVSIPGLRSAYICARNQGCFDSNPSKRPAYSRTLVTHLNRHCKELGLKPVWHHGEFYLMDEAAERIEQNFNSINLFLMERTGINLFEEDDGVFTEASHGKLKVDHRLGVGILPEEIKGHDIHIVYSLDGMKLTRNHVNGDISDKEVAYMKRYGNTDHESYGQKVLAIIDTVTNKTYKEALIKGPTSGSTIRTMLKVGEIDNTPSYKSTSWTTPKNGDARKDIAAKQGIGRVRGVAAQKAVDMSLESLLVSSARKNIPDAKAKIAELEEQIHDLERYNKTGAFDKAIQRAKQDLEYQKRRLNQAQKELNENLHKLKQWKPDKSKPEPWIPYSQRVHNESVIEGPDTAPVLSSDFTKEVGAATPQALWEWMHDNIQYDHTLADWKLKTAAELYMGKKGNCHDQSYFASFILHSWGYPNWQLYFVEFSDSSEQGGNSHTLTYYKEGEQYYWFENAWEDQAGIHGPYSSKEEIKQAVMDVYKNDNDINSHKFDGIVFGENPNYQLGMNLRDYCNSWNLTDDRRFSKAPNINASITNTTNPNDPESQEAVDIKFTNDAGEQIGEASVSAVDTDHAFLYNVEVFEAYRGNGYGKAIIEYCLSHYRITELTVEPTNTTAIKLYEQYGFKKYMDWEENGRKLIDMRRDNMKAIHEAADWIEKFVHDDVFRESASINSIFDLVKECKTPQDLIKWMKCISYAFLDKNGKPITDDDKLYDEYRYQSPLQLIRSKKGVCWDCTGLARRWFEKSKYPFCEVYVEIVDDEDCPSHTFIIFKEPGESEQVSWFESSWDAKRGIHPFGDLKTCLHTAVDEFIKSHNYDPDKVKLICTSINKGIKYGCTMQEYMDFAHNSFEIDLGDLFYDEIFNESYIIEGTTDDRRYSPPMAYNQLPEDLKKDPIHSWRAKTGIELIHREPTLQELMRIWVNWNYMSDHKKELSDAKSIEFFGITNAVHYNLLLPQYATETNSPYFMHGGDELIEEGVIPHQDYTFETLPNELYFSSPFKVKELKGQVFMSPYAGISSIFIVDRFNIFKDCAAKELGHSVKKNSVNIGYREWSYEVEDLQQPLKTVHMNHNVPQVTGTYTGSSSGYIYKVDISEVRDKLHRHGNHALDREVIYKGDKPLKILEIKPHTIKWELVFSEDNAKHAGEGYVESGELFNPNSLHWSSHIFMEADEPETPVEEQPIDDEPPSLNEPGKEEPVASEPAEEDGPKDGDELDAPIPEPVDEPEEIPTEEPTEEAPAEEKPKEAPKKESMPKKTDRKETGKNGVRRKKLYIAFIEWCKAYNNKNAFGSIFDEDAFKVSYPFVPDDMRYFYRLANPLLCILSGNLTFFPVSELRKINSQNKKMQELLIFAGTENDFRVFNVKDKGVYLGTEENGEVKLGAKLADSFDLYIQTMIDKGDILNGPIEESVEEWYI